MNVFSKVTLNSLRKNRTRTIVTIIGVILSAAMITAVTTFISSLQNYMIQNVISTDGDWHVEFLSVDSAFIHGLSMESEVEAAAVSQNIGYAMLEGGQNENKPYLFVSAFDDKAFAQMPLTLLAGRLPENDGEIIISDHIENNAGVSYKIGDMLVLTLGDRMLEDERLGQNNAYIHNVDEDETPTEQFVPRDTKTYTVVGICARPRFENYSAPGYTVITKMDTLALSGTDEVNVFVKLKQPSRVYTFSELASGGYGYTYNSDLLRYMGISQDDTFNTVLYSLGGILIALIMVGSVLLIYNSFSISVSERTRQFGILSSVGATGRQLRKSILFEGACIGLIGIPLGILAGVGGIGVTLSLTSGIFESMSSTGVPMALSVSIPSIIIAGVVGIVTILISAYIPARKAAKLSAIDAIRQTSDIKIRAKKVKTSRLVQKLFGLEGALAFRNFKRNRKSYRSTVISLFVSIVLFISASAFGMYLQSGVETTVSESGYDIMFSYSERTEGESFRLYEKLRTVNGVYESGYYKCLIYVAELPTDKLTERCIQYYFGDTPAQDETSSIVAALYLVDDVTYSGYVKELGLDPQVFGGADTGSMIAMAKINAYDPENGRYVSFDMLQGGLPPSFPLTEPSESPDGTPFRKDIAISYLADKMPEAISESRGVGFVIFAPYSLNEQFVSNEAQNQEMTFTFLSNDPGTSAKEMSAILKDMDIFSGYSLYNVAEIQESNRNIILLVNVFSYGFIILISLITIANVFNTVSTNIDLRRREFAMLKSVGMTDGGFNKMMNFECIFYGLKSLLYGLPVAFIITYWIYRSVMEGADVSFTLPWLSVGISIFSVFFVVFVTMLYSVNKVKKENTVDALRNDVL